MRSGVKLFASYHRRAMASFLSPSPIPLAGRDVSNEGQEMPRLIRTSNQVACHSPAAIGGGLGWGNRAMTGAPKRGFPLPDLPQVGGRRCIRHVRLSLLQQLPAANPLECRPNFYACVSGDDHAARSALRHPVRACPHRAGHRQEPLFPGAALQRHGPRPSARPRGDARHEGGRRLGRGLDRGMRDPPLAATSRPMSRRGCGTITTSRTTR